MIVKGVSVDSSLTKYEVKEAEVDSVSVNIEGVHVEISESGIVTVDGKFVTNVR